MDASDDACGAQLSQEHNGQELSVAFLSHPFTDTQWKSSSTKQEAYGIYYAVTKWNYYLQGSDILVCNDHKPLQNFLNGENTNNKVNRWSLELTTYNFTFEWISGACSKAADCLSQLVDVKYTPVTSTASINMLCISIPDDPAPWSKTHTPTDVKSTLNTDKVNVPPPVTKYCKDTLQLMQKTDPFCKCISNSYSMAKPLPMKLTLSYILQVLILILHINITY